MDFTQLNQNTTTTYRTPGHLMIQSINKPLPKLQGGWPKLLSSNIPAP